MLETKIIQVITGEIRPNPNFTHAKDAFATTGLIRIFYHDLAFKTFFTKPHDEKACTHLTTDALNKHENRKKKIILNLFNFLTFLATDTQLRQLLSESKDKTLMHALLDAPKLIDPVMKPIRNLNDSFQFFSKMDSTDKYYSQYCNTLLNSKSKNIDIAPYLAPKI